MEGMTQREIDLRRRIHYESDEYESGDDEVYSPYRGLPEEERKRLERNTIIESIRYTSDGQSVMTVRQILDYMSPPYVSVRRFNARRARASRAIANTNQQNSTRTNAVSRTIPSTNQQNSVGANAVSRTIPSTNQQNSTGSNTVSRTIPSTNQQSSAEANTVSRTIPSTNQQNSAGSNTVSRTIPSTNQQNSAGSNTVSRTIPSSNQRSSTGTNASSAGINSNDVFLRSADVRAPMPRRRLTFKQAREIGMSVDEYYGHVFCKRSKYEKKIEENNVMKHMKKLPVPVELSDKEE
ncbi:unnamed protein product [Auanema sp. JU1783]|nr:unnamed protein product [Auanema sp. JU1783]